jgi:uncharacterized secreted protein with C-terminal beta-propeller domain
LSIACFIDAEARAASAKPPLEPKRVSSFAQLKRILAGKVISAGHLTVFRATAADASGVGAGLSAADHSETNVQVAGVDEGDIVKTDGQYIYSIQGGQTRIALAYPANGLFLASSIESEQGFSPSELYVRGNRLVVIGRGWRAGSDAASPAGAQARFAIWAPFGESRTLARVYNIADKAKPVLEREVALSGEYLSSRLIDENLYFVARKYPDYYLLGVAIDGGYAKRTEMTPDNTLPHVSDSAVNGGKETLLPVNQISYLPGFVEPDYIVAAALNVDAPGNPAKFISLLGGGNLVYASAKNLYLSAADYNIQAFAGTEAFPVTHIYKFALNQGSIDFTDAGEVPGVALNQFSMDEYKDYFRIATTVDRWIQKGDAMVNLTSNNVYALDNRMRLVGRLENLAEGERIFAARFLGERAYLVTFRQTDPLLALDLSLPESPKSLGELKIPGFSNYLQPYDETRIVGIGQDADETGGSIKGVKLALFDVADVLNPQQVGDALVIGDQGTYSPALHDHKALLFDKKRSLLAFPIEETSWSAPGASDGWPARIFQGAQVYEIDPTGKEVFRKKAAITHLANAQDYDWSHYVNRLLIIEDQFYTVSESRIQANGLNDGFSLSGALDLPAVETPQVYYLGEPVVAY